MQREILTKNHSRLVNEFYVSNSFLASLLSESVISEEQKAEIQSERTQNAKVDKLIEILKRRPEAKIKLFCKLLKAENSDFDLLNENEDRSMAELQLRKRERNRDGRDVENDPTSKKSKQPESSPSKATAKQHDNRAGSETISSAPIVTPAGSLTILQALGVGGYGIVYKAQHSEWGTVAYKKLHVQLIKDRDLLVLKQEAEIQWKLHHPNIVQVLAIVLEIRNYGIVLEFVGKGELLDYIRDNNPDLQFKLSASYDVCLAMSYLHSLTPPLIHGDLKIENILLEENGRAKVCDFGFSKWKDYSKSHSKEKVRVGTVTHVPPELWRNPFLRKIESFDVYSYGVCLWEILAGDKPFRGSDDSLIKLWVLEDQRPNLESIPSEVPAQITELMKRCWNENISTRPRFTEIKMILEEIKR